MPGATGTNLVIGLTNAPQDLNGLRVTSDRITKTRLREWPLQEPPESMPEAAGVDGIRDPLRPFLGIIFRTDAVE